MELLRKLSRDVSNYFGITDACRQHSEVNKQADIRALAMDLKDSRVHTFTPGRTIELANPKKGKGVMDIFTEGKEVLERGAFRSWKDRTGKLGADVFGCDPEYQHQHEAVTGEQEVGDGADTGGQGGDEDGVSVEFNPLVDLELEGEI